MHRVLDRHLVSEFRRLDIDLRDHGAGSDQLALLGGPLRETRAESENEVALRDQIVGDRRRKSAADADRPRVFRKQPVTAHRCRQQRADAIGERDQRRLGIRKHGAATGENERALRVRQRIGEAFNGPRIGVQRPGGGGNFSGGTLRGEGRVLHVERHAKHHGLTIAQGAGDGT